jgi:hypothetical protein
MLNACCTSTPHANYAQIGDSQAPRALRKQLGDEKLTYVRCMMHCPAAWRSASWASTISCCVASQSQIKLHREATTPVQQMAAPVVLQQHVQQAAINRFDLA